MLSNVEQHILEETFLTAIYVGKIISLSKENAQKEEMQLFPNLDNLVIFLCRTIQGGQQLFKWNGLSLLHANQF